MKPIYVLLLISASLLTFPVAWYSGAEYSAHPVREQDNAPKLEIAIPGAPEHLAWNAQVRYAISVSDPTDGESKYGEIDARACLMQVEYFPAEDASKVDDHLKASRQTEVHKGLSLMRRSTCFGCHADKSRLAGPSFAEIAERYENSAATAQKLASHVIAGSTGIWGSQIMPAHPDLTLEEATQIVDYILEQGANKNSWIYPGLEGTFRVIEKPQGREQGIYVLTASYTSTSHLSGVKSLVYKIK